MYSFDHLYLTHLGSFLYSHRSSWLNKIRFSCRKIDYGIAIYIFYNSTYLVDVILCRRGTQKYLFQNKRLRPWLHLRPVQLRRNAFESRASRLLLCRRHRPRLWWSTSSLRRNPLKPRGTSTTEDKAPFRTSDFTTGHFQNTLLSLHCM